MHGWMKIQKYTNSKGKYLNKAFNKSINLKHNELKLLKLFDKDIIKIIKIIKLQN